MKRFSKILAVLLILSVIPVSAALTGCAVADADYPAPIEEVEAVEVIAEPKLTEQDIEKLKESCVMIYADNGETEVQGSGVAIGENRYLTAYHAIADGRTNLKTSDGEKLSIESYNEELDIMVLTSENKAIPVKIGDSGNVRLGDEVAIIGSPMGEKNAIIYTTIKMIGCGMETYNIVGGGASGGGCFSTRGELIGIVTGVNVTEYETCIVPINAILEQL